MLQLSYSGISSYQRCPRKYWCEYIARRVPIREDGKLSFGRLLHRALEAWWRSGKEAAVRVLIEHAGDIDEADGARMTAMLEHYRPDNDGLTVVDTERAFRVRIHDPDTGRRLNDVIYQGRIDMLVRDEAGQLGVVEHKHTVMDVIGYGPYWQRLSIDHQHAWYRLAEQADWCAYDVLKRPQHRPSKADNGSIEAFRDRVSQLIAAEPEVWYQFRRLTLIDAELHEAARDLYLLARQIREATRRGIWPRAPDSCRTLYGMCPYLDVCTGRAQLEDDTLFRTKETMQ